MTWREQSEGAEKRVGDVERRGGIEEDIARCCTGKSLQVTLIIFLMIFEKLKGTRKAARMEEIVNESGVWQIFIAQWVRGSKSFSRILILW